MSDQPTDHDLIVDHPFEPARFRDAWPGICGHRGEPGDWPCGYTKADHATSLRVEAPEASE